MACEWFFSFVPNGRTIYDLSILAFSAGVFGGGTNGELEAAFFLFSS
jgi:hypothetical protein